VAICQTSSATPAQGEDTQYTTVLSGIIDRTAPQQFSQVPEPSDGVYQAGDEISVEMNEVIQCTLPLTLQVRITVGQLVFLSADGILEIICDDRTISISLVRTVTLSDVAGQAASVQITDIQDLAGNVAAPVLWNFTFSSNVQQTKVVSASVSNIVLSMPCKPVYQNMSNPVTKALTQSLTNTFATNLGVSPSRLTITQLSCTNSSTQVSVSLAITSGSGGSGSSTNSRRRNTNNNDNLQASVLAALLVQYINANTALQGSNFTLVPNTTATYTFVSIPVNTPEGSTESCAGASTFTSSDNSQLSAILALVIIMFVILLIILCFIWFTLRQEKENVRQLKEAFVAAGIAISTPKSPSKSVSAMHSPRSKNGTTLSGKLLSDTYVSVEDGEEMERVPPQHYRTSYLEIESEL